MSNWTLEISLPISSRLTTTSIRTANCFHSLEMEHESGKDLNVELIEVQIGWCFSLFWIYSNETRATKKRAINQLENIAYNLSLTSTTFQRFENGFWVKTMCAAMSRAHWIVSSVKHYEQVFWWVTRWLITRSCEYKNL